MQDTPELTSQFSTIEDAVAFLESNPSHALPIFKAYLKKSSGQLSKDLQTLLNQTTVQTALSNDVDYLFSLLIHEIDIASYGSYTIKAAIVKACSDDALILLCNKSYKKYKNNLRYGFGDLIECDPTRIIPLLNVACLSRIFLYVPHVIEEAPYDPLFKVLKIHRNLCFKQIQQKISEIKKSLNDEGPTLGDTDLKMYLACYAAKPNGLINIMQLPIEVVEVALSLSSVQKLLFDPVAIRYNQNSVADFEAMRNQILDSIPKEDTEKRALISHTYQALHAKKQDESISSFVIDVMSNPYSGTLAVVGLLLIIAGIAACVVSTFPETLDTLIHGALDTETVRAIAGVTMAAGIGCMLFSGSIAQKNKAAQPEPPVSLSQ